MPDIVVRGLSRASPRGKAQLGLSFIPCALGRGGRRSKHGEGDGISPFGVWPMRHVFFRPDRVARPATGLPVIPLHAGLGWCDEPGDANYNRIVGLPYPSSHERLWRSDHLYDLIVVLGYNDLHRSQGRGSAIFMHLAHTDYRPTEGCIAFALSDMLRILAQAQHGDAVIVV
jgi:L,D-peptidoglycan transpeptidase YkuD (ErfK/YbiS/YcfS/YnhG family)